MSPAAADAPRSPSGRAGLPIWVVPIAVVLALLAGELVARAVGPDLPKTAGTDQESVLKADQMAARKGTRTDVAFIGASETAAGLVPSDVDAASSRFTGAYNAGLRGASPGTDAAWAERVVIPRLHPKVVVVGLLPTSLAVLTGSGAAFQASSDSSYAAAIDTIAPRGIARLEKPAAKHFALIRYRTGLRQPTTLIEGLRVAVGGKAHAVDPSLDPTILQKALAPTGETIEYRDPPTFDGPDPEMGADLAKVGRAHMSYSGLEHLLRSLRDEGVVPVLAIAPMDRKGLIASGLDFTDLDAIAAKAADVAEHLHVPVLNSFGADFASDEFHDRQHLDAAGSKRWSREVGAWLDDLCGRRLLDQACSAS
jgi:hypothetical protein